MLTTNITLDEATCDVDLVLEAADFCGLSSAAAKAIVKAVAEATQTWTAAAAGARPAEIRRMESAFVHRDLERALTL